MTEWSTEMYLSLSLSSKFVVFQGRMGCVPSMRGYPNCHPFSGKLLKTKMVSNIRGPSFVYEICPFSTGLIRHYLFLWRSIIEASCENHFCPLSNFSPLAIQCFASRSCMLVDT